MSARQAPTKPQLPAGVTVVDDGCFDTYEGFKTLGDLNQYLKAVQKYEVKLAAFERAGVQS
jgi:hypothetical protein